MTCPRCGAMVPEGGRFCSACGRAIDDGRTRLASDASDGPTRTADEATRLAGPARTPSGARGDRTAGSGWLSSSGSIDHGRFNPGDVVDGRYRVIELAGRGGMGEVYRADDLRLGQPVALKFLPPNLGRDPERLAQFHNEVRLARQVSHPNVCRVHDIGEVDGQIYLSMEYVDGEDLSVLLRRIGRLPEDKAIDIARQICAGLAAAHDRGVLHRDLKPANIMLDSRGRVRVMDFGLAAVGEVTDVRAGTPGYMAPEQLAGRAVTQKSDIYALGLVLFELFTGRRVFTARTVAELVEQHEGGYAEAAVSGSGVDPTVARAIARCLEEDPARRPASATAVSAALPGGDPLAAALAAGEVPSPAMVAAAGSTSAAVTRRAGMMWLAVVVGALLFLAGLSDRFMLFARVPFDKSAEVLLDRARTIERDLGYGSEAVDRESGFSVAQDYLAWLETNGPTPDPYAPLAAGRPPALLFWYRSSPRGLNAINPWVARPSFGDPPLSVTGMTAMILDDSGRLVEFHAVPPQTEQPTDAGPATFDWNVLFAAAGFDRSRFTATTPEWTPRNYADTRMAWTGPLAELPGTTLRLEAASYRGRLVDFVLVGPWTRPARQQAFVGSRAAAIVALIAGTIFFPALIVGATLLARRNLKQGLGDRAGAARIAFLILGVQMAGWLLSAHYLSDPTDQVTRFFGGASAALFQAALAWLAYLAVEPQVRKVWPRMLITWTRVMNGATRDPMLGRDLLVGTAAGLLMSVVAGVYLFVPRLIGGVSFPPAQRSVLSILGLRSYLGMLLTNLSAAIQTGMLGVLGLAVMLIFLKRRNLAFAAAVLLFTFAAAQGQFESSLPAVDLIFGLVLVVIVLGVTLRFGFVAGMAAFFAHFATIAAPLTLNTASTYFGVSLTTMLVLAGIAALGYYLARADQPLLGAAFDDRAT